MIPLQADCDMTNPEEHLLWALVALPGVESQAPMIVPPPLLRAWSAHLYRCGFRFDQRLQEIKYVPPAGQTHWMAGSGGRWVGIDEPLPAEDTAPSIDHLSLAEKQVLLDRLTVELAEPATPVTDHAEVHDGD